MLYNAYVTPVLTYNICTWALTKTEENKLDALHRKQLRSVIGVRYPNRISNKHLYEKCNTRSISSLARNSRWKMLGHVLRMADDIPAKQTMLHYFDEVKSGSGFRGKPRTTLPIVISKDLSEIAEKKATPFAIPTQLKTIKDLKALEEVANKRDMWMKLVTNMHVLDQY